MSKKLGRKQFRLVPEKKRGIVKWSRVNIDLWGLKTTCNKNDKDYMIHVMTIVDPVAGWFDLAQLMGKPDAFVCIKRFDFACVACYPPPREIGFLSVYA